MTVLDRAAIRSLQEVVGGDRADLIELVTSFLEEAPQILDGMRIASHSGDAATVRRAAHTLKSNAKDFGASELSLKCASLEADLGGQQSLEGLGERVAEILALWAPVKAALENEVTGNIAEG